MNDKISFYSQYSSEIDRVDAVERRSIAAIEAIVKNEAVALDSLSIIWVTDDYLKQLHKEFLDDPTETDVMTFNYSETDSIDAELYISVDRARAQAPRFNASIEDELCRLVIHGTLHMSGFNDSTDEERKEMRKKENEYLEQT
jgi:rRNA maturation RNase YbeY